MSHPGNRGLEYRRLSSHVQRVILGLGPLADLDDREGSGSASECGARTARGLELGSSGHEARALKEMSDSLYRHHYARGDHQQDSYAGVVVAAEGLRFESPAFVNPPLNAIWAEANHAVDDARPSKPRGRPPSRRRGKARADLRCAAARSRITPSTRRWTVRRPWTRAAPAVPVRALPARPSPEDGSTGGCPRA